MGLALTVVFHEIANKATDFPRRACVHLFAKIYKGIALCLVETENQLAILFRGFLAVFLAHMPVAPACFVSM